ncbi:MAG: hypothetical protein EP338_02340 [Bacteroidetes bacterium]|nr:MAG: hypothetical protein EP338_02340 [Bacteroidota bacterium]
MYDQVLIQKFIEEYREKYQPDWYDSYWLYSYNIVRHYLREYHPTVLNDFETEFKILEPTKGFTSRFFPQFLSEEQRNLLKQQLQEIKKEHLERHELFEHGRLIVHDHEPFVEFQKSLEPLVSEWVGEEVESSYNFLSLYNNLAVLPTHLDAPLAKWTLDCCIEQSDVWPIYVSESVDWPEGDIRKQHVENMMYKKHSLNEGDALLFCGSSQWHYRDRISGKGDRDHFCHLIFFHFIPKGSYSLVYPKRWAKHFSIPELSELVTDLARSN